MISATSTDPVIFTRRMGVLLFVLAAIALFFAPVRDARAVGKIVLEVGEITSGGVTVAGAKTTLDLMPASGPTVEVQAKQVNPGIATAGTFQDVRLLCREILIFEPRFACVQGGLQTRSSLIGALEMQMAAEYNLERATLTGGASGFAIAGGTVQVTGALDSRGWSANIDAEALKLAGVRQLAAHWVTAPAEFSFDGTLGLHAEVTGRPTGLQVQAKLATTDVQFANEEGTIAAEKVAATMNLSVVRQTKTAIQLELRGTTGQALAGPVLLDFVANPLLLTVRGSLGGDVFELAEATIAQDNLLQARAQGRVLLGAQPKVSQARVTIDHLNFPAAYTSFLQLSLATSDFDALAPTGHSSAVLDIENNAIVKVDARLDGLDILDAKDKFTMSNTHGDFHWVAGDTSTAEPSHIAWTRGSAYGFSGGAARIDFLARGKSFEMIKPSRLPIFDGAAVINTLRMRNIGLPTAELDFDAIIEPISMPLITKAFGWPDLAGKVGGSIPGLTYRNGELALAGDLVANVFDGVIIGSNLKLRDPLGAWPRLFADVTARRLDLSLVTNTFEIGSISGRLDAEIRGLELFNWSPVAFDARLYSTPGDESKKLISAKAVSSISNIGGGGGGVTAALQGGVMRFFDEFRYAQIGLSCQLRNDVCLMSGIGEAKTGYYLVRGRGLPRIDIIGNSGRVDWPTLLGQIIASTKGEKIVVQ